MKLFNLFSLIFLVSNTVLSNPFNKNIVDKVKRVINDNYNDCQHITSFLNQLGVDVNNCCGSNGIVCEDYRIKEL